MKKNKKLIKLCTAVLFSTVLFLAAFIDIKVSAAGTGRKDNIKSRGIIDYANGTVVMDSSDLTYLADEIDNLEDAYKTNTVAALNGIGTYYKTDGGIVHQKEEETLLAEQAANLSFQEIYEGILRSQSVGHLAARQAADAAGSPLYYKDEESQSNQNLISVTTEANSFPVYIKPATADNLTAGCAAWVDGTLIIGNGKDNNSYYEKGSSDVVKNIYENVSVSENYNDISSSVYITTSEGVWTEKNDSKEDTFKIPLINGDGRMLYAISFTYKHRTHSKPVNAQDSSVSGLYRLTTKEGEVIASEDISASKLTTDPNGWIKVNVFIDLFAKNFSTEDDTLYLYIKAGSHGRYTQSMGDASEAVVDAKLTFENIEAKYK